MTELFKTVQRLPSKYLDLLSTEDLEAAADNDFDRMSTGGLETIARGKEDLGWGEFTDTGTSIAGAIGGGALAGAAFGPVGAVVGGIAGGAIGAFGGELIEDVVASRSIDLYGALKEGATSALIDTALLGTGKFIRPLLRASKAPMPTAMELRNLAKNAVPGSTDSIQSTQQMLQGAPNPATLTRGQVSELSLGGRIGESVAKAGLGSAQIMEKNTLKAAKILGDNLRQQIGEGLAYKTEDVGMFVFNAYEEGHRAASDLFGKGLSDTLELLGGTASRNVPTTAVRTGINTFVKSYRKQWLDTLDPAAKKVALSISNTLKPTVKEISEVAESLVEQGLDKTLSMEMAQVLMQSSGRGARPDTLLAFYKDVNRVISDYMPGNAKSNANTVRDLTKLSHVVKDGITGILGRISPAARSQFELTNAAYKLSLDKLAPNAVPSFVTAGKNADWHKLGKTLVRARNPSHVNQLYASIDESYRVVKQAGRELPSGAPKSAAEAKEIIKASYLQDAFGTFLEDTGKFNTAGTVARNLLGDDQVVKAIAGDSYQDVQRLLNAFADTTASSKNALQSGMLAIRSGEIGNVQAAATAAVGVGGAVGGSAVALSGGLLGVAAIFGIPAVLAKIATNPKAVNRLVFINSQMLAQQRAGKVIPGEAIASAIAKIMQDFTDPELVMLEDEIRRYGLAPE